MCQKFNGINSKHDCPNYEGIVLNNFALILYFLKILYMVLWNVLIEFSFSKYVEIEVELKYCGCTRKVIKQPSDSNIWFNQTTCSMDAYDRGMGQKIVGFSLYGDYNMRKL